MILQGPVTFEDGKVSEALKEFVRENGVTLPFAIEGFTYSNTELDDWFHIKSNGKLYKMDRALGKCVECDVHEKKCKAKKIKV